MKPLPQESHRLQMQLLAGSVALGVTSLLGTLWYRLVEGFSALLILGRVWQVNR